MSYRIHAFGFPVWTFAVLISGPIWAHQAWSSYWNWDPKEVCAFITWVLYAAYLHARSTAGWKGRNAAILSLVGLASLWFNFIGINYFSTTSQHSYANGSAVVSLRRTADRAASAGLVGALGAPRELGQELVVVIGTEGPLVLLVVPGAAMRPALEQEPGRVVGAHRHDHEQQHEPPHATRVGRRWVTCRRTHDSGALRWR